MALQHVTENSEEQPRPPTAESLGNAGVGFRLRPELVDALDHMMDGLALFDADGCLVFCNKRYRSLHEPMDSLLAPGVEYDSIIRSAQLAHSFVDDALSPEELCESHRQLEFGESLEFEMRIGEHRWLHCAETRTNDSSTVSIRSDITEIKLREAELTRLSEALRSQNLHFDTALNNMAQGLCLFDHEQKLIVCNQRYLDMYGFSPEVVKPGIKLPDIMRYSISLGNYGPADASRALAERPEQAEGREQSVSEQWLRDGRIIAVLHQPMAGGGSVATYEDVTVRKRAEMSLKERTDALERGNRELEAFAHVASHDLQEPLRKIETFGDRLFAQCGDQLNDDAKQYLERMRNAAGRMRSLIRDLLSYSRVGSPDSPPEICDLNDVLTEVRSDLEVAIAEKGAIVEVGDLPSVEAFPTHMRQLFQNLLSNALKFAKPGVTPHIRIEADTISETQPEAEDGLVCLDRVRFRDNGIGFEQKHADRIFGIFQRLHGRGTHEGTGIGLATCRKILERIDATITANGTPNEGATFEIHFTRKLDHDRDGYT